MLSRVADSIYWMARNIERAENNARILSVQLIHLLEASDEETLANQDWEFVLEICASIQDFKNSGYSLQSEKDIIWYLTFDESNLNSITNCINFARANAKVSRDHLPDSLWEVWNELYLKVKNYKKEDGSKEDIQIYLKEISRASTNVLGIIDSSMTRAGEAYRFLKIGNWLEQAEKTARILNVVCNYTFDAEEQYGYQGKYYYYWRSALQLVNGYDDFLRANPPRMDPRDILNFLLADESFPRSIRYCMNNVRKAVEELENGKVSHYSWELYAALDNLLQEFDEMNLEETSIQDLSEFLDHFQNKCNEIGTIFSRTYYLIDPKPEVKIYTRANSNQYQDQTLESRSTMKYRIEHTNTFSYDANVNSSLNSIRLKPRTDECQRLLSYQTDIEPASLTNEHRDLWGNHVETFFIPEQHKQLVVKTTSIVSIQKSPFIHRIEYSPEMQAIFHSDLFHNHYLSFLNETEYTFLTREQVQEVTNEIGGMKNPVQFSIDVMQYLNDSFTYNGDATQVETKAQESFGLKNGVCQDITHVMLGILRENNIPARYVSGYLYVGENSALVGDSATHAWVEVMVPGIGWVGLDPTNNVEALENHIRVGTGRDYMDVSPVQGVYRGGGQTLDVKVSVNLIDQ